MTAKKTGGGSAAKKNSGTKKTGAVRKSNAAKKNSIGSWDLFLNPTMTVLMIVFLICSATFLVLGIKAWYPPLITRLRVPETTGYSLEVCRKNYGILIDYNMFWGPAVLKFADFPMSVSGARHFLDVKHIFVGMQYAAIASGLLLIPGVYFSRKKKVFAWEKATIIVTAVIAAIVGFGLIFAWDQAFVLMHKILFGPENTDWLFDYATDPIIFILPDEVFLTAGAMIVGLVILGLAILGICYHNHRKKRS